MNFNDKKFHFKLYVEVFLFFLLTVGPFNPTIKMVTYVILFLVNFNYWKCIRYLTLFQFILIFSIIVPMVIDMRNAASIMDYSKSGFAYLIPFIFNIMYANKYELEDFLIIVERIAFFVTWVSIIGYIILLFYPTIFYKFPEINFYGSKVRTIIVYNIINDYSGNFLLRNCGIAFEPGAFQFVCNLGLAIYIKLNKDDISNKSFTIIRYIIYSIGVFSTKSTTGIIILILVFIFTVLTNLKKNRNNILLLVAPLLLYEIILNAVNYQKEKLDTGNFEIRFRNTLFVIKNYWWNFLGIGSTGYDKIYLVENMIGSYDAYTNIYLRFGLVFTLLFIFLNFKLLKLDKSIFIIIFLTLFTENIIGPITVILYYMAMKKEDFINESNVGVQSTK